MKFTNDDYQQKKEHESELTDTVAEEHPKHLTAVAEEQIRAMHHHNDGSAVELHEVSSREFIAQSIRSSLEGKLTGNFESSSEENQLSQGSQNLNAAKIEYEKKSSENQPQQLYGAQQTVTSVGTAHGQETMMMGCNCGAEWTVTGKRAKTDSSNPAAGVKIEQYGSPGGGAGAAGYNVSGGAGGERIRYAASGSQQQEYKG